MGDRRSPHRRRGIRVPREGSNIWYDGWVIPKYAKNRKAASYFINFLCRPDIALRNMEATGYVCSIASPEIMEASIDSTLSEGVDASYFFGPEATDAISSAPKQRMSNSAPPSIPTAP